MIRLVAVVLLCAGVALADDVAGVKRRTPPAEFGRVVLSNQAKRARVPPVTFDHWLHRAKYTCRVCHVDIGFAMKAGGTDVRAADNAKGQYCGACHNDRTRTDAGHVIFGACHDGKRAFEGRKVFEACSKVAGDRRPACFRCHASPKDAKPGEAEFATFAKAMPRGRFGNGIDWEKAEQDGLIKPVDYVEGISIKRTAMTAQKDFALSAKLQGMPDIIFSHAKHTVWNGCELCHPDIFVGVKKGTTKYSMAQIFEGQYCGVCHTTVAFPLIDCQRCHTRPVQ